MNITKHPLIPKHVFVTIINKFIAIDNVLSLHYSTHISHPQIIKILNQASSLAKVTIIINDLEQMLTVNPDLYVIFRLDDELSIKFPNNNMQLLLRKEEFLKRVNSWIESHQEMIEIPKKSTILPKSPNKIIKPRSNNSSSSSTSTTSAIKNNSKKFNDLKNDPSKFKFNEKSESIQSSNFNGLSLLERIRLKEKLAKEQINKEDSLEIKYEKYLIGKISMIYDTIYQLYNSQNELSKSFSTNKLIQIIQDSSNYPVIANEIHDAMKLIESKLSKIQLIEKNGIKVVKVSSLDRDQDLKILKVN